jgi:signal transduction histidine kinase
VEDILSVQRMESYTLQRELVALQEIADAVIAASTPKSEGLGLRLVKRYDHALPPVYVDRDRMIDLFDNLLSNAIKFSPNGGDIVISIHDTGPALQVEFSDPGIGIAEDEHEKIWRRFYQVDGSTTRQYGGTGLGLTIVKQIVEAHEGRVWVKSKPNEGSIFGFTIPKTEITGTGELNEPAA